MGVSCSLTSSPSDSALELTSSSGFLVGLQRRAVVVFRSILFVAEAQFVLLLLSKKERAYPAVMLVPVLNH